MSRATGLTLASPASRWATCEALVQELCATGFEAMLLGSAEASAWAQLARPRSASAVEGATGESAPGPTAYTYVNDLKIWTGADWGAVFFDARVKPSPSELSRARISIRVKNADAALDFVLRRLVAPEWAGASAPVPAGVTAEAGVVIGPGATISAGTVLEAGVRIGANVRIGKDCRISAHSRIGDGCSLGDRVVFTGPVSVGGQGFGFTAGPGLPPRPRLHVGGVRIADDVRLGAFVAIDRGVFEDTVVGPGTALDNFVQVAHNCILGRDGIVCAFGGLSGSTELGDSVTLGGQVTTKGHLRIGHRVTVAGASGVTRDLPDDSGTWKGYPPRPVAETLKTHVLIDKLPELYDRLRKLEKK